MTDYCKYVNVFQGCGEIDLPKPQGIAAKWFFIKAGCGNTSPAATLPFGGMSVSPYSGGYPTGYGCHLPNSHSHPAKFKEGEKLLGFAHLQQSGTGAIRYYYNYALTVPQYETSELYREIKEEAAEPGYYTCVLDDIRCELTAAQKTAFHRYTFGHKGGKVRIDFTNNGLRIPGHEQRAVEELKITKTAEDTCVVFAKIEGIGVYFAIQGSTAVSVTEKEAVFAPDDELTLNLRLAVSFVGTQKALDNLNEDEDFDEVRRAAYEKWNDRLSKIRIETEDESILRIFYSNYYHSLVKPADLTGECYIYDKDKPFLTDLATLWDMYKTGLPLIMLTDADISAKLVETLLSFGETNGYVPNCMGLSDQCSIHDVQARMLGDYALLTAYHYGHVHEPERMLKVIRDDVFSENKKDFTQLHRCRSHTWTLDMADGCANAEKLARELGMNGIADELHPLSGLWKTVYDEKTGLLKDDSDYYEGTLFNYSFRQMVEMDERIALAGGKENFVKLLDRFFGYGSEDTVQPTDPFNYQPVEEGMKLGRFEGFNNESDTETPFSYIYADRHDRTCEIIRGGMKYMFTEGRGGLPGNNDTGALSSYYVLAALGLFPVAGQDLFLIGSPFVDSAEVDLYNGKKLSIRVNGNSDKNIYVASVSFNGTELTDRRLKASDLMQGGEFIFNMTDKL